MADQCAGEALKKSLMNSMIASHPSHPSPVMVLSSHPEVLSSRHMPKVPHGPMGPYDSTRPGMGQFYCIACPGPRDLGTSGPEHF